MSIWKLKIEEPSAPPRYLPLPMNRQQIWLGRASELDVPLRDLSLPLRAAVLEPRPKDGPFWLTVPEDGPEARIGDLKVRQGQLPAEIPFKLGQTQLTLERFLSTEGAPPVPEGIRPWLTCTERGYELLRFARKAAATPLAVYISGETGTGKEVLAQLVHAWSDRAKGPFVPINCGALPLSLAESELFGHVKGSFTGAVSSRPGALLQAHRGTLFLDEVADLPPDIQVKILRFLENGEIRPVGADRTFRADVRIVCATHRPLEQLVESGHFRRDLYYRIASITLRIPPLRERVEDVELLATTFARDLDRGLLPGALDRLRVHPWPGNVRELRHAVERACGLEGPFVRALGSDAFLFLRAAPVLSDEDLRGGPGSGSTVPTPAEAAAGGVVTLAEMEKVMLLRALKLARGNRATAARSLGIGRSTLFEMLKRYGVAPLARPSEPGPAA